MHNETLVIATTTKKKMIKRNPKCTRESKQRPPHPHRTRLKYEVNENTCTIHPIQYGECRFDRAKKSKCLFELSKVKRRISKNKKKSVSVSL